MFLTEKRSEEIYEVLEKIKEKIEVINKHLKIEKIF